MADDVKLRLLEGLGYCAALMIFMGAVVGRLHATPVLDYFNALGLVFAIIVIVRLMVMNIVLGHGESLFGGVDDLEVETPDEVE
ncbi:MAG: hypothetical protein ACOC7S_00385 [Planctomycetota bacterium]